MWLWDLLVRITKRYRYGLIAVVLVAVGLGVALPFYLQTGSSHDAPSKVTDPAATAGATAPGDERPTPLETVPETPEPTKNGHRRNGKRDTSRFDDAVIAAGLHYNEIDEMNLGDWYTIEAVIDLSRRLKPEQALGTFEGRAVESEISVLPDVSVNVFGTGFEIKRLDPDPGKPPIQRLSRLGPSSWTYQVRPIEAGENVLTIKVVSHPRDEQGNVSDVQIVSYDETIVVTVTPLKRIEMAFAAAGMFFTTIEGTLTAVGSIVAILAGWFGFRRRKA